MTEGTSRTPTVFVSDASAEAVRISDTLRTAGYTVVDVPLSMLLSRASVQKPNVVLVDVDAAGALDEVTKLRRQPGAGSVDFIYLGTGAGKIADADAALSHEGSAFFKRPVDIGGLVRKVEALTGGPASNARPEVRPSTPPPSIPPQKKETPSVIPIPADRASTLSLPAPGLRTPGPPLPMSTPSLVDLVDPPRSLATFGTVSSELQQLLAEAEMRADVSSTPDGPLPSPEEEIEAVLPADVLASLDEPLDADEDEEAGEGSPRTGAGTGAGVDREGGGTGAHAKGTTAGGSRQPTTGSRAATPHQTHERRGSDAPRSVTPPGTPAEATSRVESVRRPSTPAYETPGTPISIGARSDGTSSWLPTVTPTPMDVRLATVKPAVESSDALVLVEPGDARRFLADAITRRATGAACFESEGVVRRIVIREGDFVAAASGGELETLVHFLGARGELPRDDVERLASKIPPYGRHAGAALVAHGFLRQDQLWNVLRAHAEWIATTILRLPTGTVQIESEPPGRLRGEPSVFGASTGCEIFVELVRRAVAPDEALALLGGESGRIGDGPNQGFLAECSLPPAELELLSRARGGTIRDLLARAADAEIVSVLHALALLGVVDVMPAPDFEKGRAKEAANDADVVLDEEAIRARVRARVELVDEGDYFSVLGISRDATSYEVRRAFLELRRTFEPSRILTPRVADLANDVRKIVTVLEEAYEILRDNARRERYRRAIEARPE